MGENRIFHAEEHIYNLQISLSELVSLSEIQLLVLSAISLLAGIVLSALISLSELSPRVAIALSALVSLSKMLFCQFQR